MTDPASPFSPVTVVIVACNSARVLPGCLACLPEDLRLVVVDNASSDGSADLVRRLVPSAEIIVRPVNEGFGGGANIGLNRVKTEFGLLLNPDTTFDAQKMIGELIAAARRYPEAGLLAPMLKNNGELMWGRQIFGMPPAVKPQQEFEPEGDTCSAYAGGAAMFFRMEAFKKIGGFDENLFLFYEDDDICLRLRKAGYSLVHVAKSVIDHQGGASTSGVSDLFYWKQWHMAWSRAHMERKWHGPARLAAYLAQEGTANLFKLLTRPGDSKRPRYAGRLAALAAYAAGRRARDIRLGPAHEPKKTAAGGAR